MLIKLRDDNIFPVINDFHQKWVAYSLLWFLTISIFRGDYYVKVYGFSASQSVFHTLHIYISGILNEYENFSKGKDPNDESFHLLLKFIVRWSKYTFQRVHCTENRFSTFYSSCA